MKIMRTLISVSLVLLSLYISAQTEPPHPKFENFVGEVYRMQVVEMTGKSGKKYKTLREEYGDFVYDYPKLGTVDLPALNIPETNIHEGKFPGVDRNTQYAMVLHSKMTTSLKACYEFSLHSDDGSILWIDGQEVVNNDGGHRMTLKKDSLVYGPGTYDIKVWYFQSLANRFGLVLDAKIIGRPEVCPNLEPALAPVKLTLDGKVYFESGSYALKSSGQVALQRIADTIADLEPKTIQIIGFTDRVGHEEANLHLSTQRADVIAQALGGKMDVTGISLIVEGRGESEPIADNDTEEGRARNRRVEIILKK